MSDHEWIIVESDGLPVSIYCDVCGIKFACLPSSGGVIEMCG